MSGELGQPGADAIGDDLLILFPHGSRPTARQVRARCGEAGFVDADGPDLIDHGRAVDIAPPSGIALQRSGLTFDLVGLAPGRSIAVPDIGSGEVLYEDLLPSRVEAISLRPGPHIAGGRRNLPVLREWFVLARDLGESFGAQAVCWVPGGVAIGVESLTRHIQAWDSHGQVPVSLLASFRLTLDGALQSNGLAYFNGQEFRIETQTLRGGEEALARLIFTHLFYAGRQEESGELASPDGHPLRLEPSGNRRFVRVWPG